MRQQSKTASRLCRQLRHGIVWYGPLPSAQSRAPPNPETFPTTRTLACVFPHPIPSHFTPSHPTPTQVPVERTPVSRVFLVPDEFHLLQYRATIAAVRRRIEAKKLPVRDAFIAFNSSKTGALSCSEMYGALEWLGIRVTPSQVRTLRLLSPSPVVSRKHLFRSGIVYREG